MSVNNKSLATGALLAFVAITAATIGIKEYRHTRAVTAAESARAEQAAVPDVASAPAPSPTAAAVPTSIPEVPAARPVASARAPRPVRPAVGKPEPVAATPAPVKPSATVVVTYFRATARCMSCLKIEDLTNATMTTRFSGPIAEKRVVWRVLNVDEPEFNHYIKDYRLYTKSVVVSEVKEGKEVRWKNLDQVWSLLKDPAAFQSYVEREVQAFLEEA